MIRIPDVIKDLFITDNVKKNFRVIFPNGEYPDMVNNKIEQESVTLTESISSQSVIQFGLCESPMIEFVCHGMPNFTRKTIKCQLEVDISSLSAEDIAQYGVTSPDVPYPYYVIPYGTYIVKECKKSGDSDKRKVVGYSKLAYYDGKEVTQFLDALSAFTWKNNYYFYLRIDTCLKLISPIMYVSENDLTNAPTVNFGNSYLIGSDHYTGLTNDTQTVYHYGSKQLTYLSIHSKFTLSDDFFDKFPLIREASVYIGGTSAYSKVENENTEGYIKSKMDFAEIYASFDDFISEIKNTEYGDYIECFLDIAKLNQTDTPIYVDEAGAGQTHPIYIDTNRDTNLSQKVFIKPYKKYTDVNNTTYNFQEPFYTFSEIKTIDIPNDGRIVYMPRIGLQSDPEAATYYSNYLTDGIKLCPWKDNTSYYVMNMPDTSGDASGKYAYLYNVDFLSTLLYVIKTLSLRLTISDVTPSTQYKTLTQLYTGDYIQFDGSDVAAGSWVRDDSIIRITKRDPNITKVKILSTSNNSVLKEYNFNHVNDTGYLYIGRDYMYNIVSAIQVYAEDTPVSDTVYLETFKGVNGGNTIVSNTKTFNDNCLKGKSVYTDPIISESGSLEYNDIIKVFNASTASYKTFTSANINRLSTTRANLTLTNSNHYTVKNEIGAFSSNLGTNGIREMIQSFLEIQGKFGMIDRTTGDLKIIDLTDHLSLYPAPDLYPAQDLYPRGYELLITRNMYKLVEYEDSATRHYDRISCTWTDSSNNEHYQYYDIVDHDDPDYDPDDYQTYSLSENYFIKNKYYTVAQVTEILHTLGDKIKGFQYFPCDVECVGLPYVETGDGISVVTRDSGFTSFVLRRTIKGIQSLEDNIEAR